jgi:CheY-like chemotaxis protein
MPHMTGLQLAEAIRAEWPEFPIILTTGYGETPSHARAFPKLTKPFFEDQLAAKLATVPPRAGKARPQLSRCPPESVSPRRHQQRKGPMACERRRTKTGRPQRAAIDLKAPGAEARRARSISRRSQRGYRRLGALRTATWITLRYSVPRLRHSSVCFYFLTPRAQYHVAATAFRAARSLHGGPVSPLRDRRSTPLGPGREASALFLCEE